MNNRIQIINGGEARYLSELPEFQDGLPHGIVNKTKTDVGGTYVAANCRSNYIIVCPFRDLVDSIAADENNTYDIFKCYGGVRENQFNKYMKDHQTYKIAVTYDSLPKLLRWMDGKTGGWKILVDEYHIILEDMDFREKAINELLYNVQKFQHYTFLSATPMNEDYEIPFFKNLPHYTVEWNGLQKIEVKRFKATKVVAGLTKVIDVFRREGLRLTDINGEVRQVEQLFIFLNSVTSIQQIVSTLELDNSEVKICCADRQRNRLLLGKYEIETVSTPNKRINFFTKKCFQGCNLFSNNGLVIVASDGYRQNTLVDVATTMEQIAGRIRVNENFQNVFRHVLVHIFTTNKKIMSDEEFWGLMNEKEIEAEELLSSQENMTVEQSKAWIRHMNLENTLVSERNGRLVYNEQKKQSFIFKHNLRKEYKDGVNMRMQFVKSKKFVPENQQLIDDFDIVMNKTLTISYEQLLKDYLDHPYEQYEVEYPEFKDFRLYLTETEMNSLRWNKEKMVQAVQDKKKLQQVFRAIYKKGEFLSNKALKKLLSVQFQKVGIKLTPKATLILQCSIYKVDNTSEYIDGKKVNGYRFGDMIFDFKL
jgi:hypothetical protein